MANMVERGESVNRRRELIVVVLIMMTRRCWLSWLLRQHAVFDTVNCAKASPSAKCVTVTNAVCSLTDTCSHSDTAVNSIIQSSVI